MSRSRSQAGSWAGIPAGGKLIFVGNNKPTTITEQCPTAVFRGRRGAVFDFRKLTSALWLLVNA